MPESLHQIQLVSNEDSEAIRTAIAELLYEVLKETEGVDPQQMEATFVDSWGRGDNFQYVPEEGGGLFEKNLGPGQIAERLSQFRGSTIAILDGDSIDRFILRYCRELDLSPEFMVVHSGRDIGALQKKVEAITSPRIQFYYGDEEKPEEKPGTVLIPYYQKPRNRAEIKEIIRELVIAAIQKSEAQSIRDALREENPARQRMRKAWENAGGGTQQEFLAQLRAHGHTIG